MTYIGWKTNHHNEEETYHYKWNKLCTRFIPFICLIWLIDCAMNKCNENKFHCPLLIVTYVSQSSLRSLRLSGL